MVMDASLEREDTKQNPEKQILRNKTKEELITYFGNDDVLVSQRIRLLWFVREFENKALGVSILAGGLASSSVLLQHEICYVMGQMREPTAIKILEKVLNSTEYDVMTRHEAGEALGAIGEEDALPILKPYLDSDNRILRETCELAIQNIKMGKQQDENPFSSVDPAPPFSLKEKSLKQLQETFLNEDTTLFDKYRAMFALRNLIGDQTRTQEETLEAIKTLCQGFALQKEGALFKHEIGFVLGQLQDPRARAALETVLKNKTEHAMVRHEVAEALGSISDDQSLAILKEYTKDDDKPVADSCEVALDMHQYWSQYAPKDE